ncbi:MAG: transposase [Chitinispirillaceae bacterium]|nr:transposase [Chitinispirillaceae bacterium]
MHGVFTEPSFFYIIEFIKGILICSRKAVTRFYLFGNHSRHFTDYHRFLNHSQWEPKALAISISRAVVEAFNIMHLILGLDDTLIPKYGKKIWSGALRIRQTHRPHFDHAAR